MVNSGVNAKRTESNGEHKCCLERIGVLQDVNDGCPMHYGTAWWPLDRGVDVMVRMPRGSAEAVR